MDVCDVQERKKERETNTFVSVYESVNIYNITTVHNKCAKNWKQTV